MLVSDFRLFRDSPGNYSVYNFNKNTQRICGSEEGCVTVPIGRPREEKPQSQK